MQIFDKPRTQTTENTGKIETGFMIEELLFLRNIGKGGFADVWLVYDALSKRKIACKVEKTGIKYPLLENEISILRFLTKIEGIPKVFFTLKDRNNNYMFMENLGSNLETIKRNQKLSIQQICDIGSQMVTILSGNHYYNINIIKKEIHKKGILHRDIKPDNIVEGQKQMTFYLIDYGLAKSYCDKGVHRQFKNKQGVVGTARYASINALKGYEQSRRDDLESLYYTLIYLLEQLPWINVSINSKLNKYDGMIQAREQYQIFHPPIHQQSLDNFYYYVKSLKFEDPPDYQLLKSFLKLENQSLFVCQLQQSQSQSNDKQNLDLVHEDKMNMFQTLNTPRALSYNNKSEQFEEDDINEQSGIQVSDLFNTIAPYGTKIPQTIQDKTSQII